MAGLKKKSKRQSTRLKHKIEKKIREHKKKVKKQEKKNPHKRKTKDPGVPNSLPFKETILKQAEDRKKRLEEQHQMLKEKRKKEKEKILTKKRNLEGLVKDAEKRGIDFDKKKRVEKKPAEYNPGKGTENSLKAYYREFRKVIDAADVVLEVLDARDPIGSRCEEVEQTVIGSNVNKKLVLVLNKIDLVPRENVEAWLKHLRNEFPTIAFKASTQNQSDNLSHSRVPLTLASDDLRTSRRCLGADMLMKLLGNYCRNADIRTSIKVGVVGFPNTGKSSVINSLKRGKACMVGATPGMTRSMQEVTLDKHIKLLDSPGIVLAEGQSDTAVILRNCVRIETLTDPAAPVAAILSRCNKQQLMLHYGIGDYKDIDEFLKILAKRFGRLKKGGVPDVNKSAKTVLQDWTSGKISYYTHPPEQHTLPTHISAEFVTEMGKEFNIDDILNEETKLLDELDIKSTKHMAVKSMGPMKVAAITTDKDMNIGKSGEVHDGKSVGPAGDADNEINDEWEDEDEEEDMEDDDLVPKLVPMTVSMSGTQSRAATDIREKGSVTNSLAGNKQANKAKKLEMKKMKKKKKRADVLAGKLSDALTGAMTLDMEAEEAEDEMVETGDEDYDFNTDFS